MYGCLISGEEVKVVNRRWKEAIRDEGTVDDSG